MVRRTRTEEGKRKGGAMIRGKMRKKSECYEMRRIKTRKRKKTKRRKEEKQEG